MSTGLRQPHLNERTCNLKWEEGAVDMGKINTMQALYALKMFYRKKECRDNVPLRYEAKIYTAPPVFKINDFSPSRSLVFSLKLC